MISVAPVKCRLSAITKNLNPNQLISPHPQNMKSTYISLIACLFHFFAQNSSFAQEQVTIHHTDEEFNFDGLAEEPFWQSIEPIEMVMSSPVVPPKM